MAMDNGRPPPSNLTINIDARTDIASVGHTCDASPAKMIQELKYVKRKASKTMCNPKPLQLASRLEGEANDRAKHEYKHLHACIKMTADQERHVA